MNSRCPFGWTRLDLPVPLHVDTARAAVGALAGISGHPRLVLEARGEGGRVSWYLGAEEAAVAATSAAVPPCGAVVGSVVRVECVVAVVGGAEENRKRPHPLRVFDLLLTMRSP